MKFVLTILLLLTTIHSDVSFACSVWNFNAHREQQLFIGYRYGVVCIVISLLIWWLNRRFLAQKIFDVVVVIGLLFHPAWWVRPDWAVSCEAENVFYAKITTVFFVLTLTVCSYMALVKVLKSTAHK